MSDDVLLSSLHIWFNCKDWHETLPGKAQPFVSFSTSPCTVVNTLLGWDCVSMSDTPDTPVCRHSPRANGTPRNNISATLHFSSTYPCVERWIDSVNSNLECWYKNITISSVPLLKHKNFISNHSYYKQSSSAIFTQFYYAHIKMLSGNLEFSGSIEVDLL